MFYSPLIELIERALRWAKNYGSRVFWGWFWVSVITGTIYLDLLETYGFHETLQYLIIWLVIFPGMMHPVYLYEKQWKAKKEKE